MSKKNTFKLGLFIPTYHKDYNKVSASIWIRVYQMVQYYESFGIKVFINNPFIKFDVSIVYRLSNDFSLNVIKYLKKISDKVYWDTCVNYYELHDFTNQKQVETTKLISSISDGVITSTDVIATKAKNYNDNIFVMDDPIDFKHFSHKKTSISFDNPVFGWSGISHKANFLNKYKNYINSLLIISEKKPNLEMNYSFFKWRYESFPFLISKVDIALLPREYKHDPYNEGHSSFKALVFAAQGIPILANKLPSYEKLNKFYDGIVFMEDHDTIFQAQSKLMSSKFNISPLKDFYSCENQSFRLLKFLRFF